MNPVWLIAIPLALAFVSAFWRTVSGWALIIAAFFNAFAGVFGVIFLTATSFSIGGWKAPYGISLLVNDATKLLLPIANILFLFAVLSYLRKGEETTKYSVVFLVALASLNGILLTNDLFNLFVFLEIAGISAYLLASTGEGSDSKVASFKYLMIGSVGSLLYLLGVAILYGAAGTLNISELAARVSSGQISGDVTLVSSLLIVAGLGVESKLLPFNGWVPDVLTKSSREATLVLASVYPLAMVYAFSKVILAVGDDRVLNLVVLLGIATVLVGEVIAFGQKSLRRTLAYSSIAQSGLAIFLVGIGSVEAVTGSIMLLINNALSKFMLFSIDDQVIDEAGRDDRDTLYGYGRKSPIVGVTFVVSALSIAGMPLFFGFRGKLNAISASFEASLAVPVLILIAAAIEVTYYFRWIFTFFKPVGTVQAPEKRILPSVEFLAFGLVLSTVIVFLGVSSGEAFTMFERAADSLVNGILAIGKAILGGM